MASAKYSVPLQYHRRTRMPIHKNIRAYNKSQSSGDKRICDALAKAIERHLPDAENKIWHVHPV